MFSHDGLFWRRFAYLGCAYAPDWFRNYSPPVFGSIIFALVRRNRSGAVANMRRLLGTQGVLSPHLAALRMFVEFSRCFAETMEQHGPNARPVTVDLPEVDPLGEALEQGKGVVIVTSHLGNWDIAAKALRCYGRPVNVVMAREVNTTTHEFVRDSREQSGVRVIFSDTSAFSSFKMLHALRRGEIVAMQIDRSQGIGGARFVPFFGEPAPFAFGPFVLARSARSPLIPVFVPRLGRRHYAVRLGGCFSVPRDANPAHLQQIMEETVGAFERIVREFPTQWFQFAPFWSSAGGGEEIDPGAHLQGGRLSPRIGR